MAIERLKAMFDDLNDLYQEVILEPAKSPRNFRGLGPVREHLEEVLWARLEELIEKK